LGKNGHHARRQHQRTVDVFLTHACGIQTLARHAPAYVPLLCAPLPPNPPIGMETEIQDLLSQADRDLGRLDGSIPKLPDPDLFVYINRTVPVFALRNPMHLQW